MYCKYCGAPLEDDENLCPKCQRVQNDPPASNRTKVWQLVACIVGGVLLLGVLTAAVLAGMGVDIKSLFAKKPSTSQQDPVSTEDVDVVVATIGDRELTNGELQVYYWTHVFDYINQYYYYGLDFDPEQPLDEQVYNTETGQTWHEYFLDMSFKTWQRYEAMDMIAKKAGLSLSQESQDYLDNLESYLAETAEYNEFENADAMIADRFGPGCAYRHYRAFVENYCIGLDFVGMMAEDRSPTAEEIEQYYNDNLEELTEYNATKEDGNLSNVRHILIVPKSEEEDATTFTDAQWAAALASCEAILNEWKAGEATEESFTQLAIAKSEDPGVTTNSGLYEGVGNNTGYVEAFEEWAADPARQAGQTGIVKTEYGYHIMYCVSTEPLWESICRQAILTEQISSEVDVTVEENPMTTYADKVVLGNALEGKF